MPNYSQLELDELIRCPKTITDPPKRKMYLLRGSWRDEMQVKSTEGNLEFHVFMRKNCDFEEYFSIGMRFLPKDGSPEITLIRCNGPHGDVLDDTLDLPHHFGHHIHRAREENIDAGRSPERGATATTQYSTFDDALAFFLQECNIQGADAHFAYLYQRNLFEATEDDA